MKRTPQGMTAYDAAVLRGPEVEIHACWKCVWSGTERFQWRMKDLKFIGARLFCPQHLKEEKERLRVKDSQPIVSDMD